MDKADDNMIPIILALKCPKHVIGGRCLLLNAPATFPLIRCYDTVLEIQPAPTVKFWERISPRHTTSTNFFTVYFFYSFYLNPGYFHDINSS